MTGKLEESAGINPQEEKELRRVYNYLCGFQSKSKLYARIKPLFERSTTIQSYKKSPETVKVFDSNGTVMSPEEIEKENQSILRELSELKHEVQQYDNDPNKKIHPGDINEALKSLGKKYTKKEIEDMIWEVDDNLDGAVDWEETKTMFIRNVTDTTGFEPNSFFHVIQFLTYDKEFRGRVTVDDTMSMLYARYGRDKLESKVKELFGHDLGNSNGHKELSFIEYMNTVREKEVLFMRELKKAKKL